MSTITMNDNNSTQVREDDACSEVETEGALASSEGYSADYSESISSGSSSSSDRRESRDTMGHICTKDDGDDTIVKGTQKKLDAASPSRNDLHNAQQQNNNDAHHTKRRYSASKIEQNTHRRHKHHHHNKEQTQDVNRQMDDIMNLYNVR